MKMYYIRYEARDPGAIGIFFAVGGYASGENESEAFEAFRMKRYNQYEFGSPISIEVVNP